MRLESTPEAIEELEQYQRAGERTIVDITDIPITQFRTEPAEVALQRVLEPYFPGLNSSHALGGSLLPYTPVPVKSDDTR